ncbi:hypothetical protein I7I51_01570 [Histoplasma capsulatum]|uniref:Uncharacterized protein n=1 Tax=Ajellomyces capsulatus TaxID=5037 RepID=A0A8A1MIV5_AJECA|nr:hypothetical protein I7I51_01570 [Histoplasma capsulatum]
MGTSYEYQQASKCAPGQVIIEPRRPLSVQRFFPAKYELLLPDSLETGQDVNCVYVFTTGLSKTLASSVLPESTLQKQPIEFLNHDISEQRESTLYRCLPTAFTLRIMSSSKDRAPSDTATLTGTGENSSGTQGTGIRRQLGRKVQESFVQLASRGGGDKAFSIQKQPILKFSD